MPRHSRSRPGSKPGVSTNVTIGRLKLSHHAMNRAALRDASMSIVPARCAGWLATTPIGRPSSVASAVTRFGAYAARSSRRESASTTSSITTRTSYEALGDAGIVSAAIAHERPGSSCSLDRGGSARWWSGRYERIAASASRAISSSRTTSAATPLRRSCTALPPSSVRETDSPVKSAIDSGPVTNANASSVITTWSKHPKARAGPETQAPVTASTVGTTPDTATSSREAAPGVQRGDAFTELGSRRVELADERDPELSGELHRALDGCAAAGPIAPWCLPPAMRNQTTRRPSTSRSSADAAASAPDRMGTGPTAGAPTTDSGITTRARKSASRCARRTRTSSRARAPPRSGEAIPRRCRVGCRRRSARGSRSAEPDRS